MSAETHPLQIAGIVQETPDTRSFILRVPDALRERFIYRAGQFLTFEIPWDGMRIRRSYSLSSAPECDAWHKVTVKRVDEGRVSNWFNDTLKVGDTIHVTAPEGRFVLNAAEQSRPLVLFGGGSGITPVISLLKSALLTTQRKVKLIYANRDVQSVIFQDELALWCKRYPARLQVVHHLDTSGSFLGVADIRELIGGWEESDFYVCGPTAYMDTVEEAFNVSGIDRAHTKFERFISPLDPDRRPAEEPEVVASGDVPSRFTMTLEGATHEVGYEAGETLLEAAVRAGHRPPSSCEDGYCGCCMAKIKSGEVKMKAHDALTDDDLAQGWILTCQARCAKNEPVEIDYDAPY